MSIREFLNTEGNNSGKISGNRMAIDVNSTMSLSYTENGSVLLGCVGSGIITPELLNNYIDVDGKLTKSIVGDKFIISSLDLENWVISDYYNKTYIDNLILDYYTKSQVDVLLDDYVLTSYLTANYYTSTDIDTILVDYVQFGYLDHYYFTRTDIVLNYYDRTSINNLFYNKVQSDGRFINIDKIGVASGVCPLDAGSKVPVSYLPSAIMTYEGLFDAHTNTPTLNQPNDNPLYTSGAVFIVQNTIGFDPSVWNGITLRNGDWLILDNNNIWQKSENTDDLIISFNGRVGAVESVVTDYSFWFYQKNETYTKTEVNNLLEDYPTLNYLTTNFYNKSEINSITYTQLQINAMLNNYVLSSYLTSNYYQITSLYTKAETDNLLNNYVLSSVLTNYYTSAQCDTLFYTKTYIGNNFYTESEIDSILLSYVTSSYLTANYYTQTQSNANYYTKTYINDNCVFKTGAQNIAGVKTFTNGVVISTNDKPMLSLVNSANIVENQFWSFQNLSNVTNPYFFGDMRFGNADDDTFKARFSIYKVSATENRFAIGLSSTGSLMDYLLFYNNAGTNRIDSNYQLKLLSGGTTITPVNSIDIANKAYCDTKLDLSGGTLLGALILSGDPTVALNPVSLQYLQANYATTTTNNLNYARLATANIYTAVNTFKQNSFLNLTATNGGIKFSNDFSEYPTTSGSLYGSEISNNIVAPHKALMIAGNYSAGTGKRIIKMWDVVNAMGDFNVLGNTVLTGTATLATVPTVNSSITNKLYVDTNFVNIAGFQVVSGAKQFTNGCQFTSNLSYAQDTYSGDDYEVVNVKYGNTKYARLANNNTFTGNIYINSIGPSINISTNSGISDNMSYYLSTNYTTAGSFLFGDLQIGTTGDDFKARTSIYKVDNTKSRYAISLSSTGTFGGLIDYIYLYRKGGNAIPVGIVNTIDMLFYTNLTAGGSTEDPYDDTDIVNKRYVDNNFVANSVLSSYVTLATTQTISGDKIFTGRLDMRGSLFLGNNNQFNINFTHRGLILSQEDIYILCQNTNGIVRIGSEGGGTNTGKLLIYRSCDIGLGVDGYRGDTYIKNGTFQQWDKENSILVNRFRNAYPENLYAQIMTDYSLNNNGDGRYLRRVAVERNGVNDIRVYNLLSDGTNGLLTYDETQRINGTITRYMRNSNVILDKNKVISALNVMPFLSTSSATVPLLTAFRWEAQYIKKNNNYICHYYRMVNFDEYGYANYKSVPIKSMTSNSAMNYNRFNFYSFMSYGDAVNNNFSNIRFGISTRPPGNLISPGATGTLRYGLYSNTAMLPPQINYLTRFWKFDGLWYKGQTNLNADNFNPIVCPFNESKRYIYTCAWTYDYWNSRKSIIITTSCIEYDTGLNIFFDVAYLTNYNNTGLLLDIEEISPMICVTSPTDGVNLEILTNINPDWLNYMVGANSRASGYMNVFDP
jgi:hypothetical protein